MDEEKAAALLGAERARVSKLLDESVAAGVGDRAAANDQGDISDPAVGLIAEQSDDAVAVGLRERLAAIERAEQRLRDGTFGRSIRSGLVIPDERLEAEPAAELTLDEARQGR